MIHFTTQHRLLLAVEPADFRKGIDSLAALCQQVLNEDPYTGAIFAFANRNKTAVKLLMFDTNGFWLALKRFSSGKLTWWPSEKNKTVPVRAEALQVLLSQGDPRFMHVPSPWRNFTQPETISEA